MKSADPFLRAATAALGAGRLLWPRSLRAQAAEEHEQVVLEVLRAEHARGGWRAVASRWLYELLDTLIAAFVAQPERVRRTLLPVAAAAVTVFPLTHAMNGVRGVSGEVVISASDPAGEFSLTFRRGIVVGATVDRIPYGAAQLVQSGDSVSVIDVSGRTLVAVEYRAPGTIRWNPRSGDL